MNLTVAQVEELARKGALRTRWDGWQLAVQPAIVNATPSPRSPPSGCGRRLAARSGVTWSYGWSAAEISCSDKWRTSCSPTPSGRLYASFRNSMPYFRNCWRSRASLGNMVHFLRAGTKWILSNHVVVTALSRILSVVQLAETFGIPAWVKEFGRSWDLTTYK
jgi:hypothetical protein